MTQDEIETGLAHATMRNIRFAPNGLTLVDWCLLLIAAMVVWAGLA